LDPVDPKTGKNRMGGRLLRKGETSFFLLPGERLDGGIRDAYILAEDDALLLRAREKISEEIKAKDEKGKEVTKQITHEPGDRWMVYGPADYIPATEVDVIEKRSIIPLDKNEGI